MSLRGCSLSAVLLVGCAPRAPVVLHTAADLADVAWETAAYPSALDCADGEDRIALLASSWFWHQRERVTRYITVCWSDTAQEGRWRRYVRRSTSRTPLVDASWPANGPERAVVVSNDPPRSVEASEWASIQGHLHSSGFWEQEERSSQPGHPCFSNTVVLSLSARIQGREHEIVGGCGSNGDLGGVFTSDLLLALDPGDTGPMDWSQSAPER